MPPFPPPRLKLASDEEPLSLKVQHAETFRRLRVEADISWNHLKSLVADLVGLPSHHFAVFAQLAQSDSAAPIHIRSDKDLNFVKFKRKAGQPVRLFLSSSRSPLKFSPPSSSSVCDMGNSPSNLTTPPRHRSLSYSSTDLAGPAGDASISVSLMQLASSLTSASDALQQNDLTTDQLRNQLLMTLQSSSVQLTRLAQSPQLTTSSSSSYSSSQPASDSSSSFVGIFAPCSPTCVSPSSPLPSSSSFSKSSLFPSSPSMEDESFEPLLRGGSRLFRSTTVDQSTQTEPSESTSAIESSESKSVSSSQRLESLSISSLPPSASSSPSSSSLVSSSSQSLSLPSPSSASPSPLSSFPSPLSSSPSPLSSSLSSSLPPSLSSSLSSPLSASISILSASSVDDDFEDLQSNECDDMESKLKRLETAGYRNRSLCSVLLRTHDGNIDEVIKSMKELEKFA